MEYEVVIGLEVHAELSTASKIYCSCKNAFGLEVNTQCCPVCMGMPGTLPTLNEKVVDYAVKAGLAFDCNINQVCKQDRKNYFYPDLPKAYQISQSDIPVCEKGYVDVLVENEDKSYTTKRIGITRVHIEEDAGKLLHNDAFEGSLVDFNRCGVPLIEIVSEPDMRSSAEAKAYLDTIKMILQYIDVSDCKMQEGSIRCDVNVSVHPKGSDKFGTRCEMKNVNTFSGAVRGIEYEAKRQIELLESGKAVEQETRRWDDAKGISVPLRSKEDAHDYRYFPEPDLLTIVIPDEKVASLKAEIPELPNKKIVRYMEQLGLTRAEAGLIVDNVEKSAFFEAAVARGNCKPKSIANWLLGDIAKYQNETGKELSDTALTPNALCDMLVAIETGKISNAAGKTVLEVLLVEAQSVDAIIEQKGLAQISDNSALEILVDEVFAANTQSVLDYKNGKTNAMGYLMGQCMKASKGKGNPAIIKEMVTKRLNEA